MPGIYTEEIRDRFEEEQAHIKKYVTFLKSRSELRNWDVRKLDEVLEDYELPRLVLRRDEYPEPNYSMSEATALLESIEAATPAVQSRLSLFKTNLDKHEPFFTPLEESSGNYPDLWQEWLEYTSGSMGDIDTLEHLTGLRDHLVAVVMEQQEHYDGAPTREELKNLAEEAIEFHRSMRAESDVQHMQELIAGFDHIRFIARMTNPETEINVLRQGFILLMTAFDAAVFDLVKAKFKSDFHSLIGVFAKDDKVSLKSIGEAGTFDAFRDDIVEKQLRSRYLKDLLSILSGLGIPGFDPTGGVNYSHLVELVLRRNVHVHGRGIADERYFEKSPDGKIKFNIYNLKVGQSASIDEPYWESANKLCGNCINVIAAWAGE